MFRNPAPVSMKKIGSQVGRLATSAVVSLLLMAANIVVAAPILDQFNGAGQGVYGTAATDDWQQKVTAGMDGTLSRISLYSYGGPTTFKVYVNVGSPWQSDPNEFEVMVTRPWGSQWFDIDVSAANIRLSRGNAFVIGAQGESLLWGSDNTYAGGWIYGRYGSNPPFLQYGGDLAFATYMEPIPEPSIAALSMIAAATFAAVRRRRSREAGRF
jgi:hypothetical protein